MRLIVPTHGKIDSRLSFGHVVAPGVYAATVTRPDLFQHYLTEQLGLLIKNHGVPVTIGLSDTPMPVHFAVAAQSDLAVPQEGVLDFSLRDVFDVPDLNTMNDDIVNGVAGAMPDGSQHLAAFTAQRVDYSLARLAHYTATAPEHFQNSSCSPTISSMSTSSRPLPAASCRIRTAAIPPSSPQETSRSPTATTRSCRCPSCRRCRPIT